VQGHLAFLPLKIPPLKSLLVRFALVDIYVTIILSCNNLIKTFFKENLAKTPKGYFFAFINGIRGKVVNIE